MNPSRFALKVGLFVFVGLVLLAGLLLLFSKGTSFLDSGYDLRLRAHNVGGLKPRAQVLMSGVQIGRVADIQLAPDGKSVVLTLRIRPQYKIFRDARFVLQQSGFLGDQYVGIIVTKNEGDTFAPGEEAKAEAPLDMQEVARSAAALLVNIDVATTNVNAALTDARHTILSATALTNLSETFKEFHEVTLRSLTVMEHLDALVETNRQSVNLLLSNLLVFSERINQSSGSFNDLVATNAPDINTAVRNIATSSATLKDLLAEVQNGNGLAGKLLVNGDVAANVSLIVSNLSITTSNLNRLGLWNILWEHKPARTKAAPAATLPLTSPKDQD